MDGIHIQRFFEFTKSEEIQMSYVYYITTDERLPAYFPSADLIEYIRKLEKRDIALLDVSESKLPLQKLDEQMKELGGETDWMLPTHWCFEKDAGNYPLRFRVPHEDEAGKKYFEPKLKRLKSAVEGIQLLEAIMHAPNLDVFLNDKNGDRVMLITREKETMLTFDDFIRQLDPYVSYYVYELVLKYEIHER